MKKVLIVSILCLDIILLYFNGFSIQKFLNIQNNERLLDLKTNQGDNVSFLFSCGPDQSYYGKKIVLDTDNNIYIIGTKVNEVEFYSSPIITFIIKFNKFGEKVWNFTIQNNLNPYDFLINHFIDISVDAEFNVYSCRAYTIFSTPHNVCWNILKLKSSGILQWNQTFKGTAEYMNLDSFNNIYISGYYETDAYYNFLCKINEHGAVLLNKSLLRNSESCKILYVDKLNKTYSAGEVYSASSSQFYYRIYNSSGDVIFNMINNIEFYHLESMFFDNNSNLYITGSRNGVGCALFKFNSSGTLIQNFSWQYEGFNKAAYGISWSDIVVDFNGNIYCAGTNSFWSGTSFSEVCLFKFNKTGALEDKGAWKQRNSAFLGDVAVDINNNIYLTGHWEYGVFVVKNPPLGEFSKEGIFYIYIDIEVIINLLLFFGSWCLLGIILYIWFIKKRFD